MLSRTTGHRASWTRSADPPTAPTPGPSGCSVRWARSPAAPSSGEWSPPEPLWWARSRAPRTPSVACACSPHRSPTSAPPAKRRSPAPPISPTPSAHRSPATTTTSSPYRPSWHRSRTPSAPGRSAPRAWNERPGQRSTSRPSGSGPQSRTSSVSARPSTTRSRA